MMMTILMRMMPMMIMATTIMMIIRIMMIMLVVMVTMMRKTDCWKGMRAIWSPPLHPAPAATQDHSGEDDGEDDDDGERMNDDDDWRCWWWCSFSWSSHPSKGNCLSGSGEGFSLIRPFPTWLPSPPSITHHPTANGAHQSISHFCTEASFFLSGWTRSTFYWIQVPPLYWLVELAPLSLPSA